MDDFIPYSHGLDFMASRIRDLYTPLAKAATEQESAVKRINRLNESTTLTNTW